AADPTTAQFYARQWHLRAIGADAAWAAGRLGSPDVTVAVIDTGISYTHPDLQGRVDLSRSISLRADDDAYVAANFPGHHPITDVHFHGTHVASTISSNGIVGAGMTSRVTLIGVKVINRFGRGTFGDVLAALYYAADQGADVVNVSLGSVFAKPHNGRFVAAVQQAFNYAHRKGALVVVAAGNELTNLDKDGAAFKLYCSAANVVCVSATGPISSSGINGPWVGVDTFAWYSNYGRSAIDVAGPGGTSAGMVWAACTKTSFGQPLCLTQNRLVGSMGTSMAAPHVSGLAALLVEDVGRGRPSQVKARLLQTADDLGARGTDPHYGKGRINAPRALGLQ
ncbi:MAG TPA: S8 family serine peptidase, partial [Vicinamibacterales bacterium]|nr:S8 family serine peptidase [Vicinamibacterales bacterium]